MNAEKKEQMQKKTHWCYCCPGMLRPAEKPEGLESLTAFGTARSETDPASWADCIYRWPATAAEVAAWHWCQAHRVMIPAGYEVVDFREPENEITIDRLRGRVLEKWTDSSTPRPILRKRQVAMWRPAVDGDEVDCPLCRHPNAPQCQGTLLRVLEGQDDPYVVDIGTAITRWSRCEIMEVKS